MTDVGERLAGTAPPESVMKPPNQFLKACQLGRRTTGRERWLLRGICVTVYPGDRLAIVGPSGAGKTLLLRALALLDPLDEGLIQWNGRGVSGNAVPNYRREVVYLHQRPALFDGSVKFNLRLPFALKLNRDRAFDEDRILNLLEKTGRSASFLQKSSRNLSGGEAQIVALARAIQLDPSVLLLDEPAASLDAESACAIEELVLLWISEKPAERAFVWVSHDLDQIQRVAARSMRMQSGTLEACI
jgi:putative ABC transport system ATP-binding protein